MENLGTEFPASAPSREPTHPLAGVISALRRVAFILLLAGAAETAIWYGNVHLSGAPGGSFGSIAVGVIAGTFFLAATMAVLAFILDLQIFVNGGQTANPATAEYRPLTTREARRGEIAPPV